MQPNENVVVEVETKKLYSQKIYHETGKDLNNVAFSSVTYLLFIFLLLDTVYFLMNYSLKKNILITFPVFPFSSIFNSGFYIYTQYFNLHMYNSI